MTTNEFNVAIRKAWLDAMSDADKSKLSVIEKDTRFLFYHHIDNLVRDAYLELLQEANVETEFQTHPTLGNIRQSTNKVDTAELIIEAARIGIDRFSSTPGVVQKTGETDAAV